MLTQRLGRQLSAFSVVMLGYGFAALFVIGGFFIAELPFVFAMVVTEGFLLVGERGYKSFKKARWVQEDPGSGWVRPFVGVLWGIFLMVCTVVFFALYIVGMTRFAQSDFAVTASAFAAPFAFVMHFALIRNKLGKQLVANMRSSRKR